MKKILTITTILAIALVLCVLPVFAAQTEERATKEGTTIKVSDITNEDSISANGEVGEPEVTIDLEEGDNVSTVVVTYKAADLKIVPKGEGEVSRPIDAAWLGVRLTPTETYTKYSCSIVSKGDLDNDGKSVDYYVAVTPAKLEEAVKGGKDLVYTDQIVWLEEEESEEADAPVTNLKVIVKADKMLVYDENDENPEWNEESYNNAVAARETAKKAEAEKAEKDTTPKTGVENYLPALGLVAVVTLAGAVILKRN